MKVKLTERFSWLFPTAHDSFCSSTWEKKLDNMKPDEVVSKIQAHEMLIFEGDGSLQPKILLSRLTPERGRGHPIFFREVKKKKHQVHIDFHFWRFLTTCLSWMWISSRCIFPLVSKNCIFLCINEWCYEVCIPLPQTYMKFIYHSPQMLRQPWALLSLYIFSLPELCSWSWRMLRTINTDGGR